MDLSISSRAWSPCLLSFEALIDPYIWSGPWFLSLRLFKRSFTRMIDRLGLYNDIQRDWISLTSQPCLNAGFVEIFAGLSHCTSFLLHVSHCTFFTRWLNLTPHLLSFTSFSLFVFLTTCLSPWTSFQLLIFLTAGVSRRPFFSLPAFLTARFSHSERFLPRVFNTARLQYCASSPLRFFNTALLPHCASFSLCVFKPMFSRQLYFKDLTLKCAFSHSARLFHSACLSLLLLIPPFHL